MEPYSESILVDYLYEIVPATGRRDSHQCDLIEGFLIAAKRAHYDDAEPESLVRHRRIIEDTELSSQEKQYSDTVIHVVERTVGLGHRVNLDTLTKRIEWVSQFQFSKA